MISVISDKIDVLKLAKDNIFKCNRSLKYWKYWLKILISLKKRKKEMFSSLKSSMLNMQSIIHIYKKNEMHIKDI